MYCTGEPKMPQSHTQETLCMCCQNPAKKMAGNFSHCHCWLHKPGVLGSIPGNCCMAFSLASIFTSKENCDTILSTHFVMKMAKFDLDSNTNSPRAWIPPPIPAHAEAERPEEKGEGQVCRRAWTRYGRTNQRVVSVAGQKDLSTRIWWVMHAATISSMYYNSVNNSGKHCSEPPSLVPIRHQIFACALWPCWKMGSGHFSLLNWGVILRGVSACCRTNHIK